MKQVIIEVEKWYAFGNHFNPNLPEDKLRYAAQLYVPNIGQCCLGFVCQALGAPLERIKGITMPVSISYLHKYPEIRNSWMVEHADSSELACGLANVNDAAHHEDSYDIFTIEEKMGFLITALLEQDIDLQFV